jgi:hypothetical protein
MISIQRSKFYCDDCADCAIKNKEKIPIFTDQKSLIHYVNPDNVICVTQTTFCKHKLSFSYPGVCVLPLDSSQREHLILNTVQLASGGIYRSFKLSSTKTTFYKKLGCSDELFNFESISNGSIIEFTSYVLYNNEERIQTVHAFVDTINNSNNDVYKLEKLYGTYYVLTVKPLLTKRALA